MLHSMSELENYSIGATDGHVGHVEDFYFDDDAWVIRYLVVKTGAWLAGRKVLISPIAVGKPNCTERLLPVAITKAQVKNSPDIDTDEPVSRQHEQNYIGHYGYPDYWGSTGMWGGGYYPGDLLALSGQSRTQTEHRIAQAQAKARAGVAARPKGNEDPQLRSCKAVIGHRIESTDGEIGHVSGLLVDEQTWAIRYMVVNTSNWWLGHQVLIAPQWINDFHWAEQLVSVHLSQQEVKTSPPFTSTRELNRAHEADLYEHYGRVGYWPPQRELATSHRSSQA
jgi:uncharacterized protein YrrD